MKFPLLLLVKQAKEFDPLTGERSRRARRGAPSPRETFIKRFAFLAHCSAPPRGRQQLVRLKRSWSGKIVCKS